MPTIRLIINADDLGISTAVNAAIGECIDRGEITATTLLANGPAFEDAVERCRGWSDFSVGVHLNLMEFRPIFQSEALTPLLNATGEFRGNAWSVDLPRATRQAIEDEWLSQISRVRAAGIEPTHLVSHFHIHTRPELFGCLRRVVRERGVWCVRITKNLYSRSLPVESRALLIKKGLWNTALRHTAGAETTDHFTEFASFMELARARELPQGTIETMVHPGATDSAEENRLLASPWQEQIDYTCQLISYRAFKQGTDSTEPSGVDQG